MTERQVRLITDFQPDIITVTPTYMLAIADEAGCGSCRPPPRPAGPTGRRWCWRPTTAAAPSPPSTSTNNTPVHVIAALLRHATLDTVMVYAKLYPTTLVESYRQAMRGIYIDVHGAEALRTPTVEEWAAFSANCSMRDMGTHLCALPTGNTAPRTWSAMAATTPSPRRARRRRFAACSPATPARCDDQAPTGRHTH